MQPADGVPADDLPADGGIMQPADGVPAGAVPADGVPTGPRQHGRGTRRRRETVETRPYVKLNQEEGVFVQNLSLKQPPSLNQYKRRVIVQNRGFNELP